MNLRISSSLNGLELEISSRGIENPVKENESPKLEALLRAAPLLTSSKSTFNEVWALLAFLMCVFLPLGDALLLDFLIKLPLPPSTTPRIDSLDPGGDFKDATTDSTS